MKAMSESLFSYEKRPTLDVLHSRSLAEAVGAEQQPDGAFWHHLDAPVEDDDEILDAIELSEPIGFFNGPLEPEGKD
jgi:hypothetical protein